MMIHIRSNNSIIPAFVFYNFTKLKDVIILKLGTTGNQQEFILTYKDHKWTDTDNLHIENPALFEQILERLQGITKEAEREYVSRDAH